MIALILVFFLSVGVSTLSISSTRGISTRNIQCVTSYVNDLASVLNQEFRSWLLNNLLSPSTANIHPTKAQIVLNVGAGSSGTKSLYLAMQMLNVTASHYRLFSQNCSSLYRDHSRSVFQGKPLTYDPNMVFWGKFNN